MSSNAVKSEVATVIYALNEGNDEQSHRILLMPLLRNRRDTPSPSSSPTINNFNRHSRLATTSSTTVLGGFHLPTVVNYSIFLTIVLVLWVFYLILPKGLRKHLCNAYPMRYKRSNPNRTIRVLGRTYHNNPHSKKRDDLTFTQSYSSELSDSSSVNSTYNRGTKKFLDVKRGSPERKVSPRLSQSNHNQFNQRIHSHSMNQRYNIQQSYSSDLSIPSAQAKHLSGGVLSERKKIITSDSSDFSSIIANNKQDSETMSSAGLALWGSPNSFVQRKIIEDNNNHTQHALSRDNIEKFNREKVHDHVRKSHPVSLSEVESFASSFYTSIYSGGAGDKASDNIANVTASPLHPDENCGHAVPSQMVLSSTLLSFRDPGIRLVAHGTQCQPRRIWIRLDINNEQLIWRTENIAQTKGDIGNDSDLVSLGQVHEIPLLQVLFVDVGKATSALQLLDVHDDYCFSVLTNGGSLDLQASNKLERDALVSCMCLILDTIYKHLPPERSWRRLNDATGSVSNGSFSTASEGNLEKTVVNGSQKELKNVNSKSTRSIQHPSSSSSHAAGSVTGSDIFHGVDLGSQVSLTFGEI